MASTAGADAAPVVLVVDDCSELLEIYAMVLEAEGFRVITRRDGRQGLEAAAALRPDVVVLDMMMPEVDGLEFLRRLPAHDPRAPRVIACSGYEQLEPQARELLQPGPSTDDVHREVTRLKALATQACAQSTTRSPAVEWVSA